MFCDPMPSAELPGEYRVRLAREAWERAGCHAVRRAVFCGEQGLFGAEDIDAIDEHAQLIAAIACSCGQPHEVVGTVRIHEAAPGRWHGSRLAVLGPYRGIGRLGTELIRLAVGTAHGSGARRFLAHVQARNVELFRKLHWRSLSELRLHGLPHHLMEAELAWYPPAVTSDRGLVRPLARAA